MLSEATLLAAQDLAMLQVLAQLGMASLESPLSEDLAPLESSLRRVNFTPAKAGLLPLRRKLLESLLRQFFPRQRLGSWTLSPFSDVVFPRQRLGFSSILSEVFLPQRLGFWSLLSAGGCGFWICDWTWFCFSPSSLSDCQLAWSWIQQSCYVAATLNRRCQQVTWMPPFQD